MDTRVNKFLFKKAVGLLEAWKGRPPPPTLGDIESGLIKATQSTASNQKYEHSSDRERSKSSGENDGGDSARLQGISPTLI